MSGLDPEGATRLVVESVRRAKKRAVLLGGWGGLAAQPSSDDILFVDDVPHDWLLPRVSTFVHHGGVGTTAAGLRAGKPAVVIPFFADQPAWARRVVALGAGPAPIPRRKLTVDRLAVALERADAPAIVEAAAKLGERIRSEDGVGTAVRTVLRYFERQADAGTRG
jgi:sterol 3beta-glucosyltransferase